jgi:hypothetical protein
MSAMNIDMALLREELEGCLHLGMEREALRLAGRILRTQNLNATAFDSAINALLICEDRLGRWVARVESAFAALNRRDQRRCSTAMFNFYVSLNRWTDAARFLPRRPASAEELLFSMWTLLNLRRMEEASALLNTCYRWFTSTDDEFEESCLAEAIAACEAQTGSWAAAETMWQLGADRWPFAPQAWEGLVKLNALRGLLTANQVFRFVSRARRTHECQSPNAKVPCAPEQLEVWDQDLHRHAKHLAKVIPAKERWQFGL